MKRCILLAICTLSAYFVAEAQNFSKFDVTDNTGKKGLNGLAHRPENKIIEILVPEGFNLANVSVDYALEGTGILSENMPTDFTTPKIVKTKTDASASTDTEWTVTLREVKSETLPFFLDFSQAGLTPAAWNESSKGWAYAGIDNGQANVARFINNTSTFIVAFSEAAENISYSLNSIGLAFGEGLFHIYASSDGEIWNILRTFDNSNPIARTSSLYTDNLSEDIRYVKLVYTDYTVNINLRSISIVPKDIIMPAEPEDPYKPDFNQPREIKGMKLVWSDEFNYNGKPNPANWQYENGFVRNEELQWYQSDNVNCKDGLLVIEGKREQVANPNYQSGSSDWKLNRQYAEYTSGSISTQRLKEFKYGRYEIRARIDTTLGSWPAIWGKGSSGSWPHCGEIDILEYYLYNKDPKRPSILANLAWGKTIGSTTANWNTGLYSLSDITKDDDDWCNKFHVWRMDWTADSIKLYLDDQLLNTQDLSKAKNPAGSAVMEPFQQDFYFLLNLAVGSNGGNPANSPFPIKYEVDYFRVYQEHNTGLEPLPITNLNLYPNPVRDILFFESNEPIRQIIITDLTGKLVYNHVSEENQINLSSLTEGLYITRIIFTNGTSVSRKILKIN